MTREEAIKRLKEYSQYACGIYHNEQKDEEAFDMAIEALSREQKEYEPSKCEVDVDGVISKRLQGENNE